MKSLKLPSLHHICGKKALRPEFNFVKIENDKAIATNERIAAVVGLSKFDLDLPNCYILARDWKKMCANKAAFRVLDGIIEIHTKAGVDLIRFIHAGDFERKYPDLNKVIPAKESAESIEFIGLNTAVLSSLCAAFPNEPLKFRFYSPSKAIRFDAYDSDVEIHGAIMPIYMWNEKA